MNAPKAAGAIVAAAVALLLAGTASAAGADPAYDILIANGRVIDGTGAPWINADVGVRDGRIVAVGTLKGHAAKQVIDAAGQVVTPGFIDMHSHSDLALLKDGRGMSKIMQGITTEVVGEGESMAPRKPDYDDGDYGVTRTWTTMRGYFDTLQKSGISDNVMSYVSAGQLRRYVMGPNPRRPSTPAEMEEMKKLLAEGMEDGAAGLVMNLEAAGEIQYPPDGAPSPSQPSAEDIIALAKVVSAYGGTYANHMRDQGAHVVDGINETARVGEEAHLPVEIFHLKVTGPKNFGRMPEALAAIRAARARGVDIGADVYPYIAASHGLLTEVPRWAVAGGVDKFIERTADPALRPRIKQGVTDFMNGKYVNETTGERGFKAVIIADVPVTPEKYVGKSIAQIAQEQGKAPDDEVLDLLVEQKGHVSIVMYYMSEKDVRVAVADPIVSFDTDGTAFSPEFGGRPHPRSYGTFPRVLGRYVREAKLMPLEEAVRKMTSLPARRMNLFDRGVIRVGLAADLVVFNPDTVIDRATFAEPHAYPLGINDVIVNGVTVVKNGTHTGAKPGRVLYGPGRKD